MASKKITISLPLQTILSAKQFSQETGRTFSGLIKLCLEKQLSKEKNGEDYEKQ